MPPREPAETHAAWMKRIDARIPFQSADRINEALRLHQRYRFDPNGLSRNERNRLRDLCRSLAPAFPPT